MNPSSLPPLPLIDGCLFIDNSCFIETTNTCYRKHEYSQLRRRVLAGKQPALLFGGAIHTALEYRYVKAQNQRVEPRVDDEIAAILTEVFAAHPPPEGDWRTLNWAVELFRKYNEKYSLEEFNLLSYKKPVACPYCPPAILVNVFNKDYKCPWCSGTGTRSLMVEMSFALPLFEYILPPTPFWAKYLDNPNANSIVPIIYTGRIDLPVLLDGRLFIMDHKTSSFFGPAFFDRGTMSAQQRGYCWAFKELTGQMPAGYIINGIRSKEPPLYVSKGDFGGSRKSQSPEAWWDESFQRECYYIDQAKLDEWKTNTIDKVEEFFWHYSRGYLPTNNEGCTKYNMKCPFFRVCELEQGDRLTMLNSGDYVDNTWTPLKMPV